VLSDNPALVSNVQFELPSLEGHQHTAKLVPGDFPAVNYKQRQVAIFSVIPFNPALHDLSISDLPSVFAIREMFDR
jgi:hypothetical protein